MLTLAETVHLQISVSFTTNYRLNVSKLSNASSWRLHSQRAADSLIAVAYLSLWHQERKTSDWKVTSLKHSSTPKLRPRDVAGRQWLKSYSRPSAHTANLAELHSLYGRDIDAGRSACLDWWFIKVSPCYLMFWKCCVFFLPTCQLPRWQRAEWSWETV